MCLGNLPSYLKHAAAPIFISQLLAVIISTTTGSLPCSDGKSPEQVANLARIVLFLLLQSLLHLKHLPPLLQQARGRRHMLQHQRMRYLPVHRQELLYKSGSASLLPFGGLSL